MTSGFMPAFRKHSKMNNTSVDKEAISELYVRKDDSMSLKFK
jgi:hypothetical protein